MTRRIAKTLAVVTAVLAPVLGYLYLSDREVARLVPHDGVADLASFRRVMDPDGTFSYSRLTLDGKEYTEASKLPPHWTLPSGPACIIFDESGRLIAKTRDSGEDSVWQAGWGAARRRPF